MKAAWRVVACAEYGRAGGFVQVSHGKETPLRRMSAGDGIAVYSPMVRMGGTAP